MTVAGRLVTLLLWAPLRTLYLMGPAVGGYGFWGGAQPADICNYLTGVSASKWMMDPVECDAIIDRRVSSFAVALLAAAYVWLLYALYQAAAAMWFRFVVVRPLAAELRAALTAAFPRQPPPQPPPNQLLRLPMPAYKPRHPAFLSARTPPKPPATPLATPTSPRVSHAKCSTPPKRRRIRVEAEEEEDSPSLYFAESF